ncbi:hypothetical protein ACF0H5_024416 [Mactra antiquata]
MDFDEMNCSEHDNVYCHDNQFEGILGRDQNVVIDDNNLEQSGTPTESDYNSVFDIERSDMVKMDDFDAYESRNSHSRVISPVNCTGPDVIITEADVHSPSDDLDDLYSKGRGQYQGQGQGYNYERKVNENAEFSKRINRQASFDVRNSENRKKYQLRRSSSNFEGEGHGLRSRSYQGQGKHGLDNDIYEYAVNESFSGHGNFSRNQNESVSRSFGENTFNSGNMREMDETMPQSKMGSVQDFREMSQSPSATRLSTSQGKYWNFYKLKISVCLLRYFHIGFVQWIKNALIP